MTQSERSEQLDRAKNNLTEGARVIRAGHLLKEDYKEAERQGKSVLELVPHDVERRRPLGRNQRENLAEDIDRRESNLHGGRRW